MSRRQLVECDRCGVEIKDERVEVNEPGGTKGTLTWVFKPIGYRSRPAQSYRDNDDDETVELCLECQLALLKRWKGERADDGSAAKNRKGG